MSSRGGITGDCCGAVEAVQTARPVSGDTSRTLISEGKAGEEESLDITQDGAWAPLCQKYNLSSALVSHTVQVWVLNKYGYSKVQGQLIWGKEENQHRFYDDSTGICTMKLTGRILDVSLL